MKFFIPEFLYKIIQNLGIKDVTYDFTKFLIVQAENDIQKEQKKIFELQKKYKVSAVKEMLKQYIKEKNHSFKVDEDFRAWDAAETIIKNRYKEIDKLRSFLSEYSRKHPLAVKSKG